MMSADDTGRNGTGSCGSGQAHESRSGSVGDGSPVAIARQAVRDAVYEKILDRVTEDFGSDVVEAAWGEFKLGLGVLETQDAVLDPEDPEFTPTFLPWLCFQYEMDVSEVPGDPETEQLKTLCHYVSDEASDHLSADEREFMAAAGASRFEYWRIVARHEGKVEVENLATADRLFLEEPLLDHGEYEGMVLYAMIPNSNAQAWLEGVGIISLPAEIGTSIKARTEEILAAYDHDRSRARVEVLAEYEAIYRDLYDAAALRERSGQDEGSG